MLIKNKVTCFTGVDISLWNCDVLEFDISHVIDSQSSLVPLRNRGSDQEQSNEIGKIIQ